MSTQEPPLLDSRADRPGDELDGLLRAFFKAEMPHPWPKAPLPPLNGQLNGHGVLPFARPERPTVPPWRLTSQVALAASLGGLLLGTVLLSGQFHGPQPADPKIGEGAGSTEVPKKILQSLEQPPDGPTRLRFDMF
jgi:hypothetical protein